MEYSRNIDIGQYNENSQMSTILTIELTYSLMVEAARVKLGANVLGPTGVSSKVAEMPQRDTAPCRAGARGLDTFAHIVQSADVIEETQVLLLEEGRPRLGVLLITVLPFGLG